MPVTRLYRSSSVRLLSSSLLSRHVTVRSLRSLPVPFVTEGSGKGREEDKRRTVMSEAEISDARSASRRSVHSVHPSLLSLPLLSLLTLSLHFTSPSVRFVPEQNVKGKNRTER